MRFLDANVFIYIFFGSPKTDYEISKAILQRIENGEDAVITLPVIQEVVDWLEYNNRKKEVQGFLTAVNSYVSMEKLSPAWEDFLPALNDVQKCGLDFVDSLTLQQMKKRGICEIYSHDKDFDRIDWVKRIWA